jgi:glutamate/tyrosine decarboxylase-like PLP-dependent enzyme
MDWINFARTQLSRVNPRLLAAVEGRLKKLPAVQKTIEAQTGSMLAGLEASLKPYRGERPGCARLPLAGRDRSEVLREMEGLQARERARWQDGFASGAVYHGDAKHIEFLNRVYALNSQSNPLHADLWPSTTMYEAEIVSMTAHMLGAAAVPDEICGTVTSGGTESILLAMKTYRDQARETRGVRRPEMVLPVTAHAAFDKAAQYFNIRPVRLPVGPDYRAGIERARQAINANTVVIVGSAPSFPHGTIDPIEALSDLARERGVGFHTDACLGGFVLPWAEKLGYPVPPFDFRLPGVTSISVDTHKYGYAAKGTSVVLYRGQALRRFQYYAIADWPGGLYFSPTLAGSRPGALSAACWAALVTLGDAGYLEATRQILETAAVIKRGLARIPDLKLLGDPLWVIAFASETLDVYRVLEFMAQRSWALNGLHHPPAVHLCVTLRHTQAGVAERFLSDLSEAVAHVKAHPEERGRLAPVYGLAASLPLRGIIGDLLKRYLDMLYKL